MITLIASVTKNNGIGYKGNLICRSKEDMSFFKEVTYGNTVIMGRKTFESIGRPLEGRDTIVLSKDINTYLYSNDVRLHNSIESVIREILFLQLERDYYIIGGASIYEQFLPFANKMILTRVDTVVEADTFFPEVDYSEWNVFDQYELNSNSIVCTYFRKEKYDSVFKIYNTVKLRCDVPMYGLVKGQIGTIVIDYADGDFGVKIFNPKKEVEDIVTLNQVYLELYKRG